MHIDSFGSGGAQRQIVSLALGLANRGHRVEFHTYYALDHFLPMVQAANIPVRITRKRGRFSTAPIRGLISHARAMEADAMIAFLRTPAINAEIAGLALPNCKIVVAERASIPNGALRKSFVLSQQFHRFADAVTVNSRDTGRRMTEAFPWVGKKLHHIVNGFALTDTKPRNGTCVAPLTLLTLASINRNKDALSLARALRICVQDRGLSVQINWAGEPTLIQGTCPEKEATDAYLQEHGLKDHWTWLGVVSDTEARLSQCDALIHTSLSEGFSNAVAEALLNCTPVIVGRINDQPDLVEASQAGLLFDAGDAESIADTICQFHALSDHARAQMSLKARDYAERNLSIEAMIDAYETLLHDLVGGR